MTIQNASRPATEPTVNGSQKTSLLAGFDGSEDATKTAPAQENLSRAPTAARRQVQGRRDAAAAMLRRQRLVERLHRLGPSPLGHFIREVEKATGADVTARLERYAALPADFVRANGGDKFPAPLWAIDGGRGR